MGRCSLTLVFLVICALMTLLGLGLILSPWLNSLLAGEGSEAAWVGVGMFGGGLALMFGYGLWWLLRGYLRAMTKRGIRESAPTEDESI